MHTDGPSAASYPNPYLAILLVVLMVIIIAAGVCFFLIS